MSAPFPVLLEWHLRRYEAFLASNALITSNPLVAGSSEVSIKERSSAVNLLASESMACPEIMAALSAIYYVQSIEGEIDERWSPESDLLDKIESDAVNCAKDVFGLEYANVQPLSATQANQAVYLAALQPGIGTILCLGLREGGHLSHGALRETYVRRHHNVEIYGVDSFERGLCLETVEKRIKETRPTLVVAGGSSYPREIPFDGLAKLAHEHGALFLADTSHTAGLVAAGVHKSVATSDFVTAGLHKTFCGPRSGIVLSKCQHKTKLAAAVFPGLVSSSLPNTIAAKAVALRVAQTSEFKGLQHRIQNNARAIAEVLSATGIPLYTGGTDSHLVVLRPDASIPSADNVRKLRRIGVLVNANPVPGDKPGRHNVTGIRLGTVWISQLGFDIHHSAKLAEIMARALTNHDPEELRRKVNSLLEEVLGGGSTHSCMPAK